MTNPLSTRVEKAPTLEQRAEAAMAEDALRKETQDVIDTLREEGLLWCLEHVSKLSRLIDAQSAEVKRLEGKAATLEKVLRDVRSDLDYYADSSDWYSDAYGNAAKDHGLRAAEATAAIDEALGVSA